MTGLVVHSRRPPPWPGVTEVAAGSDKNLSMHGYLMSVDGILSDATSDGVKQSIASGAYFWLDLDRSRRRG